MDVEKLARMANQIAANLYYGTDKAKGVTAVADHLRRFWNPTMRVALIDAHRRNAVDLHELVALAVEELPESKPTAAA